MRVDRARYDTDKSANYLANYEHELGHLYDEPVAILELGVQRGGSLLLWRDLFPAAQVAGLDLNPVSVPDDTGRVHVYQGFQQETEVLDAIRSEVAPEGFDIVIDDASHIGQYTSESFWHIFPRHLKPGGIYVLEDWPCGYDDDWPDGKAPPTAVPSTSTGRVEALRKRVRAAARPLAARLERHPELRRRLERLYMRAEGTTLQSRFPSHDYGMVGVAKRLVDDCGTLGDVASIKFVPGQAFVHKRQ